MFYDELDLNTIFNFLNCLIAVISLIVGISAHKKIHNNKAYNDYKKYHNNSQDCSQKANLIVNYGPDGNELRELTNENFEKALEIIYREVSEMYRRNMKDIFDMTNNVINKYCLDITGFTKIDWIHFFIECAKSTSDKYIQKIWAKVLAKEMASPDSISYTTLDVLKNMSYGDYCLFEKLCSISIDGYILQGEESARRISWQDQLKLQELRLLNLAATTNSIILAPGNEERISIGNSNEIILTNNEDRVLDVEFNIFMLTSTAKELMSITTYEQNETYIEDFIKSLNEKYGESIEITYLEECE